MNNTVTEKIERNKSIADNSVLKLKDISKETADLTKNNHTPVLAIGKQDGEESKPQVTLKENTETFLDIYNANLDKTIKLTEETATGMVEGYKKRMELYDNFNTKLMESVKEMSTSMSLLDIEKVLKLIKDNFDLSKNVMNEGMKSVIETYNKHMGVALNFNQKFSDTIIAQFKMFKDMNEKSVSFYNNLTTEWWKEHDMK